MYLLFVVQAKSLKAYGGGGDTCGKDGSVSENWLASRHKGHGEVNRHTLYTDDMNISRAAHKVRDKFYPFADRPFDANSHVCEHVTLTSRQTRDWNPTDCFLLP